MKKIFAVLFAMFLVMAAAVPAFAQAEVPENPETWLSGQVFEAPTCNPMSYGGWVEAEFDPTGGELNHYDLTAQPYQTFVVWGSGVSIDEVDYGRSLVVLNGGSTGGRWHAVIVDGAYRVGIDTWGFFPKYWQPVLICLYGGEFPMSTLGEWVKPLTEEVSVEVTSPETIIKTVEVEKIVEVPVEKEVKISFIPTWVWWVIATLGGILIWALLRKPNNDNPDEKTAVSESISGVADVNALKRKVSSSKGKVTRAEKALAAYTGEDGGEREKLEKAVKTAKADLRKAEKALKDAQALKEGSEKAGSEKAS